MRESGTQTPRQIRPWVSEKEILEAWGQVSEGCDNYGLDGTNNSPEWQEGSLGLMPRGRPRI